MTERAASSTAVLVCQGRATADGRYAVGRFSDPVARELLDPADHVVVDRVRADRVPTEAADRVAYEMVRRTGLTMVPRTISIDAAIRGHAAGQLVLLGAGLDARAWRMPELAGATVFEVDHPASQQDKLRRIGGLVPMAGRVVPVAVDLAGERLGPTLESAGFDRRAVTTWVWEGVVPYLTAGEVRATVAQIAELRTWSGRHSERHGSPASGSGCRVTRSSNRIATRMTVVGNDFAMLSDNGFDVTSDNDLLTLSEGLALPPGNNGSLRNGRVAVAVRRSPTRRP
jgi:methyltransferase (TIGR00027 family)